MYANVRIIVNVDELVGLSLYSLVACLISVLKYDLIVCLRVVNCGFSWLAGLVYVCDLGCFR